MDQPFRHRTIPVHRIQILYPDLSADTHVILDQNSNLSATCRIGWQ